MKLLPKVINFQIVREAYPDYTALDRSHKYYDSRQTEDNPVWLMVDVKLCCIWDNTLKLDVIKKAVGGSNEISQKLKDLVLVKNTRLSVQPLQQCEWEGILALRDSLM